jgi:hypothetical protein
MYETIPIPMIDNCTKLKPTEQRKALLQLIWWPLFACKKRQSQMKQSQVKQTTVVFYSLVVGKQVRLNASFTALCWVDFFFLFLSVLSLEFRCLDPSNS